MSNSPVHVGGPGAPGVLTLYPPTWDGGKVEVTTEDHTDGATVSLVFAAQAAARTWTFPDLGDGYFALSTAALTLAEMDVLDGATAGTVVASKAVVADENKDVTGFRNGTFTGTLSTGGVFTPTGGVAAAGGFSATPRLCHTGGQTVSQSTDGTELTITNTELYVAEVFIPANCTVTGAAVFWGATTDGNAKVMLFDSTGARLAISASTDISGFTGDSYGTRIAFSAPYAAVGPATYYLGVMCDTNTNTVNTHILGNFGAGKIDTLVYATEAGYADITPPTTFTTGLGPIATLY